MLLSPRFRSRPRIPYGRSPAVRRTVLWALAAVLALAGCSDPAGTRTAAVAEVGLADESGEFLIANEHDGQLWTLTMDHGDDRPIQFRLRGSNGVAIPNPADHSVGITIMNTQLAEWIPTGDRSGILRGLQPGRTSFQVTVYRDDAVVFASGQINLEIR